MKYPWMVVISGLVFCTFSLHADLTIRYKNDYKFGSLPPAVAAPLRKVQSSMPQFSVVKVKGNKGYSSNGNLVSLLDFGTQEITLLDAAGKRFATIPMKDYGDKLAATVPALPPQAQALGMKPVSSTRKTGRTDTILGVQAEESETLLSVEAPADAAGSLPAGPVVREVIQIWTAKEGEVLRMPAVREWAGYTAYRNYLMDPVSALQKVFAGMPGFGQALSAIVEGSGKGVLVLKTHVEMYMPLLAALAPGNFDPKAAVMEATSEIVELSTAPVDEAVFRLPADYTPASVGDIMKSLTAPAATAADSSGRRTQ